MIKIENLISSGGQVSITVGAAELKEFALLVANEVLAKYRERPEETFFTVDQVAARLQVSKVTLWRWERQLYLVPIKVGGKSRYRESDIKRLYMREEAGHEK